MKRSTEQIATLLHGACKPQKSRNTRETYERNFRDVERRGKNSTNRSIRYRKMKKTRPARKNSDKRKKKICRFAPRHKCRRNTVPMATLKKTLTSIGLENIQTILASGNVVFEAQSEVCIAFRADRNNAFRAIRFLIPVLLRTGTDCRNSSAVGTFQKTVTVLERLDASCFAENMLFQNCQARIMRYCALLTAQCQRRGLSQNARYSGLYGCD